MSIRPGTSRNCTARSGGFTLIELLAVMLILGVLMTLVVGASKILFSEVDSTDTKNTMKIIMEAINEYQKDTGAYPPQGSSAWVNALKGNAKSRAMIEKLPENVWSAEHRTELRDGWGKAIEYSQTGGLAGAPGLTSAGPDGDMSTKDDNVHYNR